MNRIIRPKEFVFLAALCLGLMVTAARSGSLAPPAGPASPSSAMWTLNDIYDKLDTGAAVSQRVAFAEPAGLPTNGTMHTLNEIMALATSPKLAPVQKTGQTAAYVVSDDGWYSTNGVGVTLPDPRFSPVAQSGPGTNQIRDNLTGLIWARNANLASNSFISINGTCTVANAFNIITNSAGPVNSANYGGTNDWRLPNIKELCSLIDASQYNPALPAGHPFLNVQLGSYWSSSSSASNLGFHRRTISMVRGSQSYFNATTTTFYAWPVRGGR